jgi:chromosome segregation ATPase
VDELNDAQRGIVNASRLLPTPLSQRDTAAMQAAVEVERKYENKVADLRARMAALERERTESEEEWSRNLAQRSREVERLRGELAVRDGLQSAQVDQRARANAEKVTLENDLQFVKNEKLALARELALVKASLEQVKESEVSAVIFARHFSEDADRLARMRRGPNMVPWRKNSVP